MCLSSMKFSQFVCHMLKKQQPTPQKPKREADMGGEHIRLPLTAKNTPFKCNRMSCSGFPAMFTFEVDSDNIFLV